MAIPRVFGIETEYGIISKGSDESNPIMASSVLINAYASPPLKRVHWDYEEESPLRDARGFDRAGLDLIEEDSGLISVILENGARYYVDHAHPEYSTPECSNVTDLVIHDKAGERILAASIANAEQLGPPKRRILVYKNNSDGKGNSYGCHENYLMPRQVPFGNIVRGLIPFLVTRQIFTGAGKVGSEGPSADDAVGFQISQRADFFEVEVGLETTFKRPIINTRDEPHADPEKYRRLHVIVGDANMSEISTFLKVGTTDLVLKMIEDDFISSDLTLADPVGDLRRISRDTSCKATIALGDGRKITAVEVQWEFFDWAKKYLAGAQVDAVTAEVMRRWEAVLTALETDPLILNRQLDWVAKYAVVQAYRERQNLGWDDPKLALVDLQYHDIRTDKGIYYKLLAEGRFESLVSEEAVQHAMTNPPEDTRAWFRGNVLRRFSQNITAASWDGVVFDTGGDSLQKVPTLEPLKGTKEGVRDLLESSFTVEELLEKLQG